MHVLILCILFTNLLYIQYSFLYHWDYVKQSPFLRTLGTPDETIWPGVSQFPDYKTKFPKWGVQDIANVVTGHHIDAEGMNLLRVGLLMFLGYTSI